MTNQRGNIVFKLLMIILSPHNRKEHEHFTFSFV
jgi:hypothetical protein